LRIFLRKVRVVEQAHSIFDSDSTFPLLLALARGDVAAPRASAADDEDEEEEDPNLRFVGAEVVVAHRGCAPADGTIVDYFPGSECDDGEPLWEVEYDVGRDNFLVDLTRAELIEVRRSWWRRHARVTHLVE
jgi:hypothetical protein